MKTKELRLRNYVMYNGYEVVVTGVNSPQPLKDEWFNNQYLVEVYVSGGLITAREDELEPIVITDKILKKFGLEINKYGGYLYQEVYQAGKLFIFVINSFQTQMGDWDYVEVEIKYVHQLQNLYFALTGEELTPQTK